MAKLHEILLAIAEINSHKKAMFEDPFYYVFCKACADDYGQYNWEYPDYVSTFVESKVCPMCKVEKQMTELQATLKSESVQQQLKLLVDTCNYTVCDKD